MPARAFRRVRLFLLHWHRRLGVVVALGVVWLAVTGIALNHAVDWQLDELPAPATLQQAYRGASFSFTSYLAGDSWVSHNGASTLYVNAAEVGYCASPFAGSVSYADVLVAACGDSLLLLTSTGQLIESTDLSYDLPEAISAIGVAGERLLLQAGPAVYLADLDNMDFQLEDPVPQAVSWVQPGQPGRDYQEQLEALSYGGGVTWERALLDLHSGKYFGRAGILLADLFALGMILLAVSGVWVWSTRPGRFTR